MYRVSQIFRSKKFNLLYYYYFFKLRCKNVCSSFLSFQWICLFYWHICNSVIHILHICENTKSVVETDFSKPRFFCKLFVFSSFCSRYCSKFKLEKKYWHNTSSTIHTERFIFFRMILFCLFNSI